MGTYHDAARQVTVQGRTCRGDSHLMYMVDIALTTEFALSYGGVR